MRTLSNCTRSPAVLTATACSASRVLAASLKSFDIVRFRIVMSLALMKTEALPDVP
jgi:hypothetical protein